MIYWTLNTQLSHLSESIEKRDARMWGNKKALTNAGAAGVRDHIVARAGHRVDQSDGMPAFAVGFSAESFILDIVMLDFADPARCATVWNLSPKNAAMVNAMGDDLRNVASFV